MVGWLLRNSRHHGIIIQRNVCDRQAGICRFPHPATRSVGPVGLFEREEGRGKGLVGLDKADIRIALLNRQRIHSIISTLSLEGSVGALFSLD